MGVDVGVGVGVGVMVRVGVGVGVGVAVGIAVGVEAALRARVQDYRREEHIRNRSRKKSWRMRSWSRGVTIKSRDGIKSGNRNSGTKPKIIKVRSEERRHSSIRNGRRGSWNSRSRKEK